MAGYNPANIDYTNLPAYFSQRASQGKGIGMGLYQHLLGRGHNQQALNAAILSSGMTIGGSISDEVNKQAKPTPIQGLSAHDYHKVVMSHSAYKDSQQPFVSTGNEYMDRVGRTKAKIDASAEAKKRAEFQQGSYGVEDEYRYMVSQGFKPDNLIPQAPVFKMPAAPKAAPTQQKPQNNFRSQADALLKKIEDMKISTNKQLADFADQQLNTINNMTPKTVFSGASGVDGQDLKISPASGPSKKTGTAAFRRRARKSTGTSMRTIQSVNI